MYVEQLNTEIGCLSVYASDDCIQRVVFVDEKITPNPSTLTRRCCIQLEEYFAGDRQEFDLPLGGEGTAFQHKVWRALCEVPFGKTESYKDVARRIQQPTASRAVGTANGKNPIAIIVPCHRIIGAGGALSGYAGGVDRKAWLLRHEGVGRWNDLFN